MVDRCIVVAALAAALSGPVRAEPVAASAPDWDLSPVFADDRAVAAERGAIEAELSTLGRWKGQLAEPDTVLAALDARSAVRAKTMRLMVWANMRLSRDARDSAAATDAASGATLYARSEAASAYIEPQLVELGAPRLAELAGDPRLSRHRLTLEKLAGRAAHVLPADQEALVAGLQPIKSAPAVIRDVFTDSELPWPSITIRGEDRKLNLQGFRIAMADPDRATRRRAWEAFSDTRAAFRQTEAALLSSYLAGAAWEAKLRHWPSQIEAVTADQPMPPGAFAALGAQAEIAARGPLARYYSLKARALGMPNLASYDMAAPLVADRRRYTIEDAKAMTIAAVAPLGQEYRDRLARGLSAHLMDWHPLPAKGSGAITFYVGADLPAFVELSFRGDYDSVSAVAHEWGHWLHWDYARSSGRPYETLLPPVTVGDVPSFLHELLLADHEIAAAPQGDARIAALTQAIEILRGNFYGVVSEASFDIAVRNAADHDEPLNADTISAHYCEARKRFSPPDFAADPRDCLGWVTEPYVFYDLYFYRYLLATSAAAWFAEKIEGRDPGIIARYKAFLAAGGSADASTLLKTAGFDSADPLSYAAMTRRMTRLVDQLESELKARDKSR